MGDYQVKFSSPIQFYGGDVFFFCDASIRRCTFTDMALN